jgi:S1-C subfamily serine protease
VTDSVFQGLPVRSCSPGSPAERAGVKKGDVVLLANGQRVENMQQYVVARALRTDLLELTVLRGNRMLDFVVELDNTPRDQQPPSAWSEQDHDGS